MNPSFKNLAPPLDFRFLDLMILLVLSMGAVSLIIFVLSAGKDVLYPLEIQTAIMPDGIQGYPYREQVFARGGQEPYVWHAAGLPDGLRMDSTGMLAGVPRGNGTFAVRIMVEDETGKTANTAVALKIVDFERLSPLVLKTTSLPSGRVQAKYDVALAAMGGALPYEWTFSELPAGLEGGEGTLRGVPEQAGITTVKVEVKDARAGSITRAFDLQVLPNVFTGQSAQEPLEISSVIPSAIAGIPFELQLAAKGGVPPYQWQLVTETTGLELSLDGILRMEEPGKWIAGRSFRVRVFDSASENAEARIAPNVIKPTKFMQKVFIALAALAAWVLAMLLLKRLSYTHSIYVRKWEFNLTTVLSILFFFVALVIVFNTYTGTYVFIFALIFIATYTLVNYK